MKSISLMQKIIGLFLFLFLMTVSWNARSFSSGLLEFSAYPDEYLNIKYVSPAGYGTQDGHSIENAVPVSHLEAIIKQAVPGTIIRLLPGVYEVSDQINVSYGGDETMPLIIEGYEGKVLIKGTFQPDAVEFDFPVFRLYSGNIVFRNFDMENIASCFYITDNEPIKNVIIESIQVNNTHTCINIDKAGVRIAQNWDIRNVSIVDYYRAGIRISGAQTNDILVEDVYLDGMRERTQNYCWKGGIQIYEGASNITMRNIVTKNNIGDCESYQQGEGIEIDSKAGTPHTILMENIYAENNGDASFDIKAENVTFKNTVSVGGGSTKYSYKLWNHADYICNDCKSYQVSVAHIHLLYASVAMNNPKIYCDGQASLFDNREDAETGKQAGATITDGVVLYKDECNIVEHAGSLTSVSQQTVLKPTVDIRLPAEPDFTYRLR